MSRVKLLVAIDEMEVGGSQRQIANLLTHLDQAVLAPSLLYFRNRSFLVDQIEAAGVPTRFLPKRGAIDLPFYLALIRWLRQERFDLIHAYGFTAELWTGLARLAAPGSVFVSSVRGKYADFAPWQWRLKRWVTARSAAVVSNSRLAGDYTCAKVGRPAGSCAVIYNGIAPPRRPEALPAELQALRARARFVLTFVGRLGPEKNLPCLLRALRQVQDAGIEADLWLAGDGPERAPLTALAAELALARAHFLGERRDVDAVLAASDAAVLPSLWEGVSNALLEAMSHGLPVVASAVGGTPEVVEHERTGLLFPCDDAPALAAAIARLATDRDLARQLGAAAAAEVAARFSIESMVRQHAALYLAHGRRPRVAAASAAAARDGGRQQRPT
jgi:glycosyltransferase involved in cell wall biosynthesis